MKITKEEFDSLYSDKITKKDFDTIISKIDDRFSEIIKAIKINNEWFDYSNCQYDTDESGGYFDIKKYKENIGVGGYVRLPEAFSDEIPTRWLWEDFEKDFKNTIEEYKENKKKEKLNKKQKIEEKKKKYKELHESIKKKLTAEELRSISFKKV